MQRRTWTQWGEGGPEKDALLPKNHSQRGQFFNSIKKLLESLGFDESRTQWYWWWPWYSFDTDPWGRSARVNRQRSRSQGWELFSHLFSTRTFFCIYFHFYVGFLTTLTSTKPDVNFNSRKCRGRPFFYFFLEGGVFCVSLITQPISRLYFDGDL